jgi:DRG Family Regulatory Proteins, Tma46
VSVCIILCCVVLCLCVQQRLKLPQTGLTPVTAETFAKWKADRAARKREEEVKRVEEAKKATGGRGLSKCVSDSDADPCIVPSMPGMALCWLADVLSGRALFSYDPSLFVDDEGAAGDDEYVLRDEDGEGDHAADEHDGTCLHCDACYPSHRC